MNKYYVNSKSHYEKSNLKGAAYRGGKLKRLKG